MGINQETEQEINQETEQEINQENEESIIRSFYLSIPMFSYDRKLINIDKIMFLNL